jgi:hypothetical protein
MTTPERTAMTCRRCGALLYGDPTFELGKRTSRYDRLVFRCKACRVGYSNATKEAERIEITATPFENVPTEVHAGLAETLAVSVSVVARAGKAWKFCSANSEDAATWTVVRAMQMAGQLDRLAIALGLGHLTGGRPPRVLLWGAPAPGSNGIAAEAASHLEQISRDLGENPRRRSEPDVVVVWDQLVVVIEAKLGSRNDRQKKGLERFDRYLSCPELWSAAPAEIKRVGFYELVRNWLIAWELAERTGAGHAVLANLAPARHAVDVERFRRLVSGSGVRRVEHLRWASLLASAGPAWLEDYASRLGLRHL